MFHILFSDSWQKKQWLLLKRIRSGGLTQRRNAPHRDPTSTTRIAARHTTWTYSVRRNTVQRNTMDEDNTERGNHHEPGTRQTTLVTARGRSISLQSRCCHRPELIDFRRPNLPDLQAGRDRAGQTRVQQCSQEGQKGAALANTYQVSISQ